MTRHLLTYAATFIALAVLDFLWLGALVSAAGASAGAWVLRWLQA